MGGRVRRKATLLELQPRLNQPDGVGGEARQEPRAGRTRQVYQRAQLPCRVEQVLLPPREPAEQIVAVKVGAP